MSDDRNAPLLSASDASTNSLPRSSSSHRRPLESSRDEDTLLKHAAHSDDGVTVTDTGVDSVNDELVKDAGENEHKTAWQRLMWTLFRGDTKVALYALALLIFSTGNSIFFKKMTDHMSNYPYFLSNLTTIIYVPIFYGIVLWEMKYTNFITPEMLKFPKLKFFFMGTFDAVAGLCMLFGSVHTSGSFQALLLNAVIPVTMILSIVFLKIRYSIGQYLGALIILGGVIAVIIPNVVNGDDSDNQPLFNFIFLLSVIPQGMSSVYKELAFGDTELDVNYLQAWVAIFQVFITLVLIPVNTLPFLGQDYIPWSQLPYALSNGAKCLGGVNSVTNHTVYTLANVSTTINNHTYWNMTSVEYGGSCWADKHNKFNAPTDSQCDDCNGAWIPAFLYMFFNCGYNLFIVLVIKHGSAALMYIVLTLRLPLVQLAFSLKFIQNPPDPFPWTTLLGLFIIIAGLILYRVASARAASQAAAAAALEAGNEEAIDSQLIQDEAGGSSSSTAYEGMNDNNSMNINQ